jgi:hypothetical protein
MNSLFLFFILDLRRKVYDTMNLTVIAVVAIVVIGLIAFIIKKKK